MHSKGQAALADIASELEPGTLRHQVLQTAQKFKSSWVELGALLVRVRNEGTWEQWGFKTFEDYCAKELRIKRQTALKLTNSYAFLAKHEKSLFASQAHDEPPPPEREAPAFEVVSVLAGAEERGQLSDQDYKELREKIWSEEKPTQIARELAERYPPPPRPPPPVDLVVRRLAAAARKLATELGNCRKVPAAVVERAQALADDVEELASKGEAEAS
ncbi:MAG: hypothetical protein HY901_28670 [Deltaproteobacteria bacterium]|nr:hypothetical protein [Deltaproteobacteria bacterium]